VVEDASGAFECSLEFISNSKKVVLASPGQQDNSYLPSYV
jgi:hypothetical protein